MWQASPRFAESTWRKAFGSAHSTSLPAELRGLLVERHHVVDRHANRRIRPGRPTLGRHIALSRDRIFVQRLLALREARAPSRMIADLRRPLGLRRVARRTNCVEG